MGPPDLLPFSLSYSAGHWQLSESTSDSKVCRCLKWTAAPFCLYSLQIWRCVSPNVCGSWALCNTAASSRTADQEGLAINMWILMKVIRMHGFVHSLSHVLVFLFLHEKSWLLHTVIPANIVTQKKEWGKGFARFCILQCISEHFIQYFWSDYKGSCSWTLVFFFPTPS